MNRSRKSDSHAQGVSPKAHCLPHPKNFRGMPRSQGWSRNMPPQGQSRPEAKDNEGEDDEGEDHEGEADERRRE